MFECEVTYEELVNAMASERIVDQESAPAFEAYVRVPGEGGWAPITGVIEKAPTHIVSIEFVDGTTFECSEHHLFSRLGMPVSASEVMEGSAVDTLTGELHVKSNRHIGRVEPVFDICIPSPHWYVVGDNGVIHHNTFLVLGAVKQFLDANPEAMVCLFESESAISRDMLIGRGIDVDRVAVFPVTTVEEFRNSSLRIVEEHMKLPEKERPQIMFVLDSLGMLSTDKEIKEAVAGTDTKDMTRAQLIKSTFRVLTLKLGHCNIPLAITNHVYAAIGSNSPLPESGGGSGFKYAVSTEITLTKAQYKEGEEQVGIVVTAKAKKSRLTVENTKVKVLIRYDGGLDPYYGLVPIVEAMGIIKKEMGRFVLPDGKKVFEKNIVDNPQMLYTPELLKQIDEWVKENFTYGSGGGNQGLNLSGEPDKEEKSRA